MKQYKYILFDLDGTLTDSKLGITTSVAYALEKMGLGKVDVNELIKFIGPPIKDSFMEYYKFTEAEAEVAIQHYRQRYKEKGIFENEVYDGINELLMYLTQQGYILAVATSKPTPFALKILDYFKLDHYFACIVGSNLDGTLVKKGDVINAVLDQMQIVNKHEVLMIGDREHDILGAKEQGIDAVGVEYGYGSHEELQDAGALYIIKDVNGLKKLLSS